MWAFADIARLCWRFAKVADDRLLAAGLRLIAAGGAAGLGYCAAGAVQVLAAGRHDLPLVQQAQHSSDALIGLATLLVVAGSTLPAIAARVPARRQAAPTAAPPAAPPGLQALWLGVTSALPELGLPTEARAGLTAGEQLYRQVIEIEDARLALRPERDTALESAAARAVAQHQVQDSERAAAVEGAALALAVERLRTENPPSAMPVGRADAPDLPRPGTGGPVGSLDSEVAWLSSSAAGTPTRP